MTEKLEIPEDLMKPLTELYDYEGGVIARLWHNGIERGLIVTVPANPLEVK